jgi:L-threonylcarbamoyladenylate synthase
MSSLFDCRDEAQLLSGMRHARSSIGRGELVVLPTDTVYGIAADAFNAAAVARLLAPEQVEALVERFWPGGLTVVLPSQPSLAWDLGETHGTVAVRMPDHRVALELLQETGPLAVSSANLTGHPAATSMIDAHDMLGSSVAVYLDDGPSRTGVASTIIDATGLVARSGGGVRILRQGAVAAADLREILGGTLAADDAS